MLPFSAKDISDMNWWEVPIYYTIFFSISWKRDDKEVKATSGKA